MAYYNKIGLLILDVDSEKFLVCEKAPEHVTSDYIMPGGQFHESTIQECLSNEIKEELNCEVDLSTLQYIASYTDTAAGRPDRDVSIELYQGKLIGEPSPTTEIRKIHWIGKNDKDNMRVSPIIRNKIIPDLVDRGILK